MGLTLALSACAAEQYAPGEGPAPGLPPSTPPTTGGGGGPGIDASLVGQWRNVLICAPQFGCGTGDVLRITTFWIFERNGTCSRRVVTESVAAGTPLITFAACHWTTTAHSRLLITFDGNAGTVEFTYTFVSFDDDRLSLNGIEFARVS